MSKNGYSDSGIASIWSVKFFFVFIFAVPFGRYIRNKKLRPLLIIATFLYPLFSMLLVYAISIKLYWLIYLSIVIAGASESAVRISAAPYILRNLPSSSHTAAFSANFATWGTGMILSGILIAAYKYLAPNYYSELSALYFIGTIGFFAVLFIVSMQKEETIPEQAAGAASLVDYDWKLILRVASPILIIAVGAGLTIPFINLFFFKVFSIDSNQFAILGTITHTLVVIGSFAIPEIKKRYGYQSITVTQTLSVLALAGLAASDYLHEYSWAIYLAIACFMLRQPLMSLANPMTMEMGMYYAGKKNQEMMSAIGSSIWSGSWFLSAMIFSQLREQGFRYGSIFLITCVLYGVGVFVYHLLINDFYRRGLDQVDDAPQKQEL